MRKLLIGCGIVAALVLAVFIIGGVLIGSWVKKQLPQTKEIERAYTELTQKFGDPDSYTPPTAGTLDPARIEVFTAVRESLTTRRAKTAASLSRFIGQARTDRPADRTFVEKVTDAIGMAQGGSTMIAGMLDYIGARTQLLSKNGMGEGEYSYLYALTTFGWLQWDPLADANRQEAFRALGLLQDVGDARADVERLFRTQLDNEQRALEARATRTPAEEKLLDALRTELDVSRVDGRFPFSKNMPAGWAAALEPFRARLSATLPEAPAEIALDLVQLQHDAGPGIRFKLGEKTGTFGGGVDITH